MHPRHTTAGGPRAATLLLAAALLAAGCDGAIVREGLPEGLWPGPDAWSWGDGGAPGPDGGGDATADEAWQEWRERAAAIRAEVRAVLAPYDPPWPDPVVSDQEWLADDGLLRERIEFTTFDGLRATGVVVRPDDDVPRPGLLLVHGHDVDADDMTSDTESYVHGLGLALAREGFVTLSPDVRSFGRFRPDGCRHWGADGYPARIREEGDVFLRLVVNDARVALSVLRASPYVDADRIGIGGISLGCLITLVTAAIETEPDAVLLSGLFLSFDDLFSSGHHDCQHLVALADIATSDELAATLLPRHVQVHWGEDDKFLARDDGAAHAAALVERAAALGLADRIDVHVTPDLRHAFDPPVHAAFFRSVLGDGGGATGPGHAGAAPAE